MRLEGIGSLQHAGDATGGPVRVAVLGLALQDDSHSRPCIGSRQGSCSACNSPADHDHIEAEKGHLPQAEGQLVAMQVKRVDGAVQQGTSVDDAGENEEETRTSCTTESGALDQACEGGPASQVRRR